MAAMIKEEDPMPDLVDDEEATMTILVWWRRSAAALDSLPFTWDSPGLQRTQHHTTSCESSIYRYV
jgi:hypothetical protein